MKPLREETPTDPETARARQLLNKVPEADVSLARMARVRAGVDRALQARTAKRGAGLRLSLSLPAALLAMAGASALAAVGWVGIAALSRKHDPAPPVTTSAARSPKPNVSSARAVEPSPAPNIARDDARHEIARDDARHEIARDDARHEIARKKREGARRDERREHDSRTAKRLQSTPARRAPGQEREQTAKPPVAEVVRSAPVAAAPAPQREPRSPATQPAAEHPGVAHVHAAMRALRRDGDPARAADLLDRHRRQIADSPLAEEALALRVEAAAALHDPWLSERAAAYLKRYPDGRYADKVRALRPAGRGQSAE